MIFAVKDITGSYLSFSWSCFRPSNSRFLSLLESIRPCGGEGIDWSLTREIVVIAVKVSRNLDGVLELLVEGVTSLEGCVEVVIHPGCGSCLESNVNVT